MAAGRGAAWVKTLYTMRAEQRLLMILRCEQSLSFPSVLWVSCPSVWLACDERSSGRAASESREARPRRERSIASSFLSLICIIFTQSFRNKNRLLVLSWSTRAGGHDRSLISCFLSVEAGFHMIAKMATKKRSAIAATDSSVLSQWS